MNITLVPIVLPVVKANILTTIAPAGPDATILVVRPQDRFSFNGNHSGESAFRQTRNGQPFRNTTKAVNLARVAAFNTESCVQCVVAPNLLICRVSRRLRGEAFFHVRGVVFTGGPRPYRRNHVSRKAGTKVAGLIPSFATSSLLLGPHFGISTHDRALLASAVAKQRRGNFTVFPLRQEKGTMLSWPVHASSCQFYPERTFLGVHGVTRSLVGGNAKQSFFFPFLWPLLGSVRVVCQGSTAVVGAANWNLLMGSLPWFVHVRIRLSLCHMCADWGGGVCVCPVD